MTDQITLTDGGTMFSGPDSVNLFRAVTLGSALKMYARCGMIPTRGMTITGLLQLASEYTGKNYGRGNREKAALAAADVQVWVNAMRSAIPVVDMRQH